MMRLLIVLFCYTVLMDSCHSVSSCSYYLSVAFQTSYVGYCATYSSCGWWGRSHCQSGTHTITLYTTTYIQQLECCSGYGPIPNCLPTCNPQCGTNTECSAPNTCTCISGWTGSNCLTPNCSSPCDTNKNCTAPDTCTCVSGWTGNDCLTPICDPQCDTNMECTAPNTCNCTTGCNDSDCLTAICNPVCGINEECNKECTTQNNCICVSGWEGYNCLSDINKCSQNISCHQCTSTNGSYYCSYNTSTEIATNGIHCPEDIQDMTLLNLSSTHCIIIWSPPFQYMQHGNLSGYNVMCNISNTNTIITSNTTQNLSFSVEFLKPFTSYICCVIPQWESNKTGKSQCMIFTTLEDVPDDSPVNVSVIVNDAFSFLIQWEPPLIPNGIITHYTLYINYTNGSEISTRTVDSQFTLYSLEGLIPYQQVGISISATTSAGEGPQSDYIYNTTKQTEPGTIQQFNITILSNTSVNISWEPPLLRNGIILYYDINIRSLQLTIVETFNFSVSVEPTENLYQLIQNLNPYIPYEVNVYTINVAGAGKASSEVFFTQETVPRVAPNIELAQRVSSTEIIIKIKPLTLEEGRGIVTGYSFNLTKSIDHCVVVDMKKLLINTLNTSINVGNLDPLSKYCLSVSAQTKEGHGLESQNILIPVYDNKLIVMYINGLDNCYQWILNETESKLNEITQIIIRVLNKVCYCSITSDYISDNTLQCDNEHRIQMRARLSAISNYTTSQLLTILQNWTADNPDIFVDDQILTVMSVFFLSNDTTPVLTSVCSNQSLSNESIIKNNVILFSAIGSAGGGSLFLCVCCIITSVCIFKKIRSKKKARCYKMQRKEGDSENHDCFETEAKINKQLNLRDKIDISPNKIVDPEDNYDITGIKNSASGHKNTHDQQDMINDKVDDVIYDISSNKIVDPEENYDITGIKNSASGHKNTHDQQDMIIDKVDYVKYEEIAAGQCYQMPVIKSVSPSKMKETLTSLVSDHVSGTTKKTSTLQNVEKESIPPVLSTKKASEQVSSDVEQLEVIYNYSYGKGMTTQKKPIPLLPPLNEASEQVPSDVEQLEVIYNYSYGKGMTEQKKPIPLLPPLNKASKHKTSDVEHFEMSTQNQGPPSVHLKEGSL